VFGGEPIDRYDSEIAYVDDKIGRMIAAVDAAGLTTSTIVAVSSDHGDEFLEHGNEYHGRSLYNEVIRVPLIVAAPGRDPAVATAPVSVIDVGPTLLDLVGLTRPTGQNGRSLAAAIGTGELPERMVLAELIADRNITRNLRAGFLGDWKLIWDLDANTYELYSLSKDPGDTDDRRGRAADVFEELRRELHRQTDLELSLLPIDREHQRRERERRKARRR
jgi:arylsulfatase A-like enzyme